MIEYVTGNILEAEVEALVNSVNCVGVMGRGVALQFKKDWPENFKAYAAACRRQEVQPPAECSSSRPEIFSHATSSTSPPSGTGAGKRASRISRRG
ncbi:MAG: macro domain-containing protein [Roseiflexus sp.]|nr:macro domain-containing protein [Roseiflexus sp.]